MIALRQRGRFAKSLLGPARTATIQSVLEGRMESCLGRRRRRPSTVVRAVLGCILFAGCGGYPDVSQATYEHSKALYAATNQRSSERIELIAESILSMESKGEMTADEARWLREIIDLAHGGDWAAANLECRKIMEDQVKQ